MTIITTPTRTLRGRTLRPLYHYARLVERQYYRKPPILRGLVFASTDGKTSVELHYRDGATGFTTFRSREAAEKWLEVFLKDRCAMKTEPKVFDYSAHERFPELQAKEP